MQSRAAARRAPEREASARAAPVPPAPVRRTQDDLPGPRAPVLLQTLQWLLTPPLRLFERLGARYGDAFRVRAIGPRFRPDGRGPPLAVHTAVVLSSPAQVRDVHARSGHALRTGQAYRFLEWYVGPESILVVDGPRHLAERRLLREVLRPAALPGYEREMRRAVAGALAAWPAKGTISLGPAVQRLALDAILAMVFGPLEEATRARLRRLIRSGGTAASLPPTVLVLPPARANLGPWSPGGRVHRARAAFRAFAMAEIEARRSRNGPPGRDLLGRLIALQDELDEPNPRERLLERLTALVGALDTTCPALAWCCYHLGRNPQAMERARAAAMEGTEGEASPGDAYLEAVCKESLRLNPPFLGSVRRVAEPTTVDGILLRPGTMVVPCVYLTHRRPELFPEPLRFRPERFLDADSPHHEYGPFGGGVRRCLGAAFVPRQMRIPLAALLRSYDIAPVGEWSGGDRRQFTLVAPKDPLRTAVRRRGPRRAAGPADHGAAPPADRAAPPADHGEDRRDAGSRPPGPSEPAALQSWRWISRPPLRRLERLERRYGDVFRLEILGPRFRRDPGRWPLARRSVVVVSRPDHLREIFGRSDDELRSGEAHEFLEWFMGPRSLLVLDGVEHLRERRALHPLFRAGPLAGYERLMREAAGRALDRWPAGRVANLWPLLERTLLEMNLAVAFGPDGTRELDRLREALRRAHPSFTAPALFLPLLRADLGRWSPGGRLRRFRQVLDETVARRADGPQPAAGGSLLAGLAALEEELEPGKGLKRLTERLLTLVAGMDSTGAAVAWTWHHLLGNPALLDRLAEEVAATRASPEDAFLAAVCDEALRLHPPFPGVVRRVARPTRIAGFDLEPDGYVMACMYLTQRRAELYPRPRAFLPERFLGRRPSPYEYAPFGAGMRRCIGAALALRQMRIAVGETLRRFEVRPAEAGREGAPAAEGRRNVTVTPAGPLWAKLRRRHLLRHARQVGSGRDGRG